MRPTLVIPGNHDLLESNLNRLDAISPIVKALGHPDLHYVKENGLFRVGNVVFSHFSIFEEPSNYVRAHEIPDEYKKVALYHGIVDRATTDVGYMLTSDKMTPSIFQGFDMALLGDIHRRQHVTKKREEIIHVDEEEVQNYLDNGWKLA
jgi:DNA repair exonuclease SbcCD nuclease subunit